MIPSASKVREDIAKTLSKMVDKDLLKDTERAIKDARRFNLNFTKVTGERLPDELVDVLEILGYTIEVVRLPSVRRFAPGDGKEQFDTYIRWKND